MTIISKTNLVNFVHMSSSYENHNNTERKKQEITENRRMLQKK